MANKHPVQPVEVSEDHVLRFKRNKIVRYILDNGGIDLNNIAMMDFSDEDRVQLAQLIGYSVSGFSDLPYVSNEDYDRAVKQKSHAVAEKRWHKLKVMK